jgi:hypothetical protein
MRIPLYDRLGERSFDGAGQDFVFETGKGLNQELDEGARRTPRRILAFVVLIAGVGLVIASQ